MYDPTNETRVARAAEAARDRDTEAHHADGEPENPRAGIYAKPANFYMDAGDFLLPDDDNEDVHYRLKTALRWDEIRNDKYAVHDHADALEFTRRLAELGRAVLVNAKRNGLTSEMLREEES